MKLNDIVTDEKITIIDALKKISSIRDISKLILFVSSSNNKIIGSITDGDIRRALIKGYGLNTKIGDICCRDFVFRYESDDHIELNSLTKGENKINVLPLLNKNNSNPVSHATTRTAF